MIVICGSAVHAKAIKSFAGLSIGLTIAFEALFGGAISGASMNPVRSLAPALVSGHFESLWIYIVATILGATSGSIVYKYIIKCKNSDECLI
jgi:aquaporin Z